MSDDAATKIANAMVISSGVQYCVAFLCYGWGGKVGLAVMFAGYVIGNVGIYMTAKGW